MNFAVSLTTRSTAGAFFFTARILFTQSKNGSVNVSALFAVTDFNNSLCSLFAACPCRLDCWASLKISKSADIETVTLTLTDLKLEGANLPF